MMLCGLHFIVVLLVSFGCIGECQVKLVSPVGVEQRLNANMELAKKMQYTDIQSKAVLW